jgi:hypothetical protein
MRETRTSGSMSGRWKRNASRHRATSRLYQSRPGLRVYLITRGIKNYSPGIPELFHRRGRGRNAEVAVETRIHAMGAPSPDRRDESFFRSGLYMLHTVP